MKLTYNGADVAIRWKVHRYFELQGAQQADFLARLARIHAWHRSQELPHYEALSRAAGKRVAQGLNAEDIQWATSAMRERFSVLMRRVADEAAPVLATLTAGQIAHLEEELAESNRDYTKKYLSGGEEKRLKQRIKRIEEKFAEWIGNLTPEQQTRIADMVRASPSLAAEGLAERKQNQQRFLKLLRGPRNPEMLTAGLRDLLVNFESHRSADYAKAMREAEMHLAKLVLDLDKTLTPTQRAFAAQRFIRFAEDFHILTAGGRVTPARGATGL